MRVLRVRLDLPDPQAHKASKAIPAQQDHREMLDPQDLPAHKVM